jgi:HD-GYP domain-containing protein (c-di-GMP phosphodiesterase class II)
VILAVAFGILAGGAVQLTDALGGLERDSLRARFALRSAEPPKDVAVVGVDDQTFDERDLQWPFPRSEHATAIDELRKAGARVIAYDVQFTEATKPAEDLALFDAIARAGNVVLATTETDENGATNILGGDDNVAAARARAAHAYLAADADGLFERFDASSGGLTSFALVAAQRAQGHAPPASAFEQGGAWIDFRGPPGTIPTYSFSDLVQGRIDPELLRGRIVVVGATSPTLQDVHPTPASAGQLMSGPEIQANAIWTALHGLPLRGTPGWLEWLLIVVLGAMPALLAARLRPVAAALLAVALAGAYAGAAVLAFNAGWVLPVTAALAGLVAGTAAMVAVAYLRELHARNRAVSFSHELELEIVYRLARAADSRDHDTGEHIDRMSRICHRLALAAGLTEQDADLLRHASPLHDIGKIAIPDAVLLKPGKLDAAEWKVMQSHTTHGAEVLSGSSSPLLQMAESIARTHHERWDGTGYPTGLKEDEIPFAGRICAVADVFDALVSARPYKKAWSVDEALAEISSQAGQHFDPALPPLLLGLEPWLRDMYGQQEAPATDAVDTPRFTSRQPTAA